MLPRTGTSMRVGRLATALLASTALAGIAPALAGELPSGGSVAFGAVGISTPRPNAMAIKQSSGTAIVNWQSFSIGRDSRVDIAQPSAASTLLNRVGGNTPSTIAGKLNANGQVYLVNPNGIAITKTGVVKAGAFVASTLAISDDDFKAGKRVFKGSGAIGRRDEQGRDRDRPRRLRGADRRQGRRMPAWSASPSARSASEPANRRPSTSPETASCRSRCRRRIPRRARSSASPAASAPTAVASRSRRRPRARRRATPSTCRESSRRAASAGARAPSSSAAARAAASRSRASSTHAARASSRRAAPSRSQATTSASGARSSMPAAGPAAARSRSAATFRARATFSGPRRRASTRRRGSARTRPAGRRRRGRRLVRRADDVRRPDRRQGRPAGRRRRQGRGLRQGASRIPGLRQPLGAQGRLRHASARSLQRHHLRRLRGKLFRQHLGFGLRRIRADRRQRHRTHCYTTRSSVCQRRHLQWRRRK